MKQAPPRPLVSIALATYNGARHLDEQLASLRAQTYAPLEIVACDDGSTDGTLAILERHAAADPRIRVHGPDTNRGFNDNFARCFALCQGPLIAPSDQDDIWLPDKLAALVPLLDDPTTAIAYADSAFVDEHGALLGDSLRAWVRLADLTDPRQLTFINGVSGHAMVFRAALLPRVLPFPRHGYFDWWLAFAALSAGFRVRYLDRPLVHYRRHTQAVTHTVNQHRNTPAYRADKHRELVELRLRLRTMAGVASPQQAFFEALERAWNTWATGLTGLRASYLVWRHADLLYGLSGQRHSAWGWARKYVAGYRLKRLFNPRRYPRFEPAPHGQP